ncbi:F-box/LRR-repeat protein 12-like [Clavelina lepadiformis]|uniref:F-box/LRR-repeat protein 12-like n=1 Tax=Clavelina lepadiformis TaxID=159417 RepID=UPI00404235CA
MLGPAGFDELPDNIIVEIFQYFNVKELLPLTSVCKRWQRLIPDQWLWKKVKFSPTPIKKVRLRKIVRQYFTHSTELVDICGKWRNKNAAYAISNNILNIMNRKSPNLITFKIEDENLHDVKLNLLPSSLQHITFTSCEISLPSLDDCIGKFKELVTMIFRRCPCLNDKHLSKFGKLDKLERLEIYGSYRIDDDAVRIISQNFPNLKYLVLVGCAFCGDQATRSITENLSKLEALEIEEWTGLSENGVNQILGNCKNMKFFSVLCHQLNNGNISIHGSRVLL